MLGHRGRALRGGISVRRNDRGDVLGFVHHPNAATAEPLENTIMGDNAAYDRTGSAHERALVTIPP